eukprot:m.301315 g.301315  ORF g.301315 m.301315 type:complete len:70 (+) comp141891_c0_seq1:14-223(+)
MLKMILGSKVRYLGLGVLTKLSSGTDVLNCQLASTNTAWQAKLKGVRMIEVEDLKRGKVEQIQRQKQMH